MVEILQLVKNALPALSKTSKAADDDSQPCNMQIILANLLDITVVLIPQSGFTESALLARETLQLAVKQTSVIGFITFALEMLASKNGPVSVHFLTP